MICRLTFGIFDQESQPETVEILKSFKMIPNSHEYPGDHRSRILIETFAWAFV